MRSRPLLFACGWVFLVGGCGFAAPGNERPHAVPLATGSTGRAPASTDPTPPVPAAPSPQASQMLELTIHEAADVRGVHQALRQAAVDGVAAATVRIASPSLQGVTLQFGASLSLPLLELHVVGDTVLHRSQLLIRGSQVSVTGLTFVGNPSAGDTLQVTATQSVSLTDLAFVGQTARITPKNARRGSKAGGRPLAVWAQGPETAATLRNIVVADGTVPRAMAFQGKPRGRFGEISLSNVIFSNVAQPAVYVAAAVGLSLDAVLADDHTQPIETASPAVVVLGDVRTFTAPPDALVAARSRASSPALEGSP